VKETVQSGQAETGCRGELFEVPRKIRRDRGQQGLRQEETPALFGPGRRKKAQHLSRLSSKCSGRDSRASHMRVDFPYAKGEIPLSGPILPRSPRHASRQSPQHVYVDSGADITSTARSVGELMVQEREG